MVVILLFASLSMRAQMNTPDDNIVPPSPQAAALARYAQVPVGLYTGVPQVNIPLYELREGKLSLPISLTYHAGGNRVDELAPRSGLGWSLGAGGVISRVVHGQADEAEQGFLYFAGIYNSETMLAGSDDVLYKRYKEITDGCMDSEPDVFSFNVGGMTGTFAFNWERKVMVSSESKVNVKCTFNGTDPAWIDSWEITGPDGTIYVFKDVEITHNVPIINPSQVNDPLKGACIDRSVVSSWYLSKIIAPNNTGTINFTYRTYFTSYYLTPSEQLMHMDYCGTTYPTAARRDRKIEITGKDLVKIETSSGMKIDLIAFRQRADIPLMSSSLPVDMPQGQNTFSLDSIIVTNNESNVVKRFSLEYDQSAGRLTLRKVREIGSAPSLQNPPYEFYYDATALPQVNSYQQDHWGFYNSNTMNTLIPPARLYCIYSPTFYDYPGANRSPDPARMKAGIITKIVYPTGGSTSFEFEPHEHSYSVTEIITVPRQVNVSATTGTENLTVDQQTFTILQTTIVEFGVSTGVGNGISSDPSTAPTIEIRKSTGELIYFNAQPPVNTVSGVQLQPGTYTLKASVWFPGNFATAYLKWNEPTSSTPVTHTVTEMAGGLRIKTITDLDGMGYSPPIVRKFIYKMDDGTSSGYGQATKVQYEYPYRFREDKQYENSRFVTVRMASNCYLHSLTQGSTVGYRQVTTLYGISGENGKTVSKFVSPYEVKDDVGSELPFPPATSYEYRRGNLLEATDYKMVNSQYVPVKMIQNTYTEKESYIIANKIGLAIGGEEYVPPLAMTPAPDMNRYALGRYLIILGLSRPSRTIETMYENNTSISKDVTLTYDTAMQFVKTKVEKVSNGKEIVTENFYPQDFVFSSGPILELKATHRFPLLEQLVSERGSDGIKRTIGASYMEYGYFGQLLLPSRLYKLTATAPLTNFSGVATTPNGTLNAAYKEVSNYISYDAQGNIQQVKPRQSENEYYMWGYNNTELIAKVQNATIDKVAYCDFESADTGGWTFSNLVTNYSTDARTGKRSYKGSTISRNITQGTYKLSFWAKAPSGMGTVTVNDLNKNIGSTWTYCEWEITPDQIIINPGQYFIQYSGSVSISLNGNLIDGIRLHPKGSLMETYTYDPLVGVTSTSSANNTTVYYEYDALGRLSVVRDNNKNIVKSYQYQIAPRQ